jgi:hypothetical protein
METFVVRVFVPATPEALPLCGLVERVGVSGPTPFRGVEELITALRGATALADRQARTTDIKEEA